MKRFKLGILTSHPIQYQTPLFKVLAHDTHIDLQVYFCWDFGISSEKYDQEFGRKIKWDIPLLSGYRHALLKNISWNPSSNFWGQVNFGIISEIIKNNHDALLLYGWNSFTNWLAILVAIITRTPIFLRGESSLQQELQKKKRKLFLKKIILTLLFKRMSALLYIGENNKNFYTHYGVSGEKLFFTPYAVDNERFLLETNNLRKRKFALRAGEGISKNDVVLLFVGKLIEKKRPFDVLKAYEITAKKESNLSNKISLFFVGDGEQKSVLKSYVNKNQIKNVHFVGFRNQTELPQYYAIADIFVLPSGEGETWGLVVNEAMCFGLPVIISDVVGCGPDLVEKEKNGLIIPLGNIHLLANAFSTLLADVKKREAFGIRSSEIIGNYSFANDVSGILNALKFNEQQ